MGKGKHDRTPSNKSRRRRTARRKAQEKHLSKHPVNRAPLHVERSESDVYSNDKVDNPIRNVGIIIVLILILSGLFTAYLSTQL